MKRCFFTIIGLMLFLSVTAQSYYTVYDKETEEFNSKTLVIENEYAADAIINNVYYNSSGQKAPVWIFDPSNDIRKGEHKMKYSPNYNKAVYHLTMKFDVPVGFLNNVYITNQETYIQGYELNWNDPYNAEIEIEEGLYDFLVFYQYSQNSALSAVSIKDFLIETDTNILINVNDLATNTIGFDIKDENNISMDINDSLVYSQEFSVDIKLTDGLRLGVLEYSPGNYSKDFIRVSNFDSTYTIRLSLKLLKEKSAYSASFEPIFGVTENVNVVNDPDLYEDIKVVYHEAPSSVQSFLNMSYGIIVYSGVGSTGSSWYDSEQNNPVVDKDTITMFLSSMFDFDMGLVHVVAPLFREAIDSSNNINEFVQPNQMYKSDNLLGVQTSLYYPPRFADYFLSAQSFYHIGASVPFAKLACFNDETQIFGRFKYQCFSGQSLSWRNGDYYNAYYQIKDGDEVLKEGSLTEFTAPFIVPSPKEYTLKIQNKNFYLNDDIAQFEIENTFDLSNIDANPPQLTSFKIIDSTNKIRSTLKTNEEASILFSGMDEYSDEVFYELSTAAAFYKFNNDSIWIPLSVEMRPELIDEIIGLGNYYSIDLATILSSAAAENNKVDLRIVIMDEAGNTSVSTWSSAFEVDFVDGIVDDELVISSEYNLSASPNPIFENCLISFNLEEATKVWLSVYNVRGNLVEHIASEKYSAGSQTISWNPNNSKGSKLSGGVYFISLRTNSSVESIKVVVQ